MGLSYCLLREVSGVVMVLMTNLCRGLILALSREFLRELGECNLGLRELR